MAKLRCVGYMCNAIVARAMCAGNRKCSKGSVPQDVSCELLWATGVLCKCDNLNRIWNNMT
eukprot:5024673-Amphidinium_carterae.1